MAQFPYNLLQMALYSWGKWTRGIWHNSHIIFYKWHYIAGGNGQGEYQRMFFGPFPPARQLGPPSGQPELSNFAMVKTWANFPLIVINQTGFIYHGYISNGFYIPLFIIIILQENKKTRIDHGTFHPLSKVPSR